MLCDSNHTTKIDSFAHSQHHVGNVERSSCSSYEKTRARTDIVRVNWKSGCERAPIGEWPLLPWQQQRELGMKCLVV
jgi:hypothetical protein